MTNIYINIFVFICSIFYIRHELSQSALYNTYLKRWVNFILVSNLQRKRESFVSFPRNNEQLEKMFNGFWNLIIFQNTRKNTTVIFIIGSKIGIQKYKLNRWWTREVVITHIFFYLGYTCSNFLLKTGLITELR